MRCQCKAVELFPQPHFNCLAASLHREATQRVHTEEPKLLAGHHKAVTCSRLSASPHSTFTQILSMYTHATPTHRDAHMGDISGHANTGTVHSWPIRAKLVVNYAFAQNCAQQDCPRSRIESYTPFNKQPDRCKRIVQCRAKRTVFAV